MIKQKNITKKGLVFIVFCLFFSSMLSGQINEKANNTPSCNEVQVWIDKVVWNTNYNGLYSVMNSERKAAPFPIPPSPPFFQIGPASNYPQTFHIAVLKFQVGDSYNSGDTFEFDVSLDLSYAWNKPVYFVYAYEGSMSVTSINNYNLRFLKVAQNNMNKSNNGGGVITTAGVLGRSNRVGKAPNGSGVGLPGTNNGKCMYLAVENRIANTTCASTQTLHSTKCASIPLPSKVDSDSAISINTYPNPAQDHLFIETDGLNVQTIYLLNLQGKSLNHQVNVSQTEDKWQINTSQLETGVYILQVETDSGTSIKKIYVQ